MGFRLYLNFMPNPKTFPWLQFRRLSHTVFTNIESRSSMPPYKSFNSIVGFANETFHDNSPHIGYIDWVRGWAKALPRSIDDVPKDRHFGNICCIKYHPALRTRCG
jgi:hypothetical protein